VLSSRFRVVFGHGEEEKEKEEEERPEERKKRVREARKRGMVEVFSSAIYYSGLVQQTTTNAEEKNGGSEADELAEGERGRGCSMGGGGPARRGGVSPVV
jgi:hypothetical protein